MDVTSPQASQVRQDAGGDAGRLWTGVVGPPLVFLFHLQAAYALAPLACRQGTTLSLHLASLVAIALSLGLGMLSVVEWRRSGPAWPDSSAGLATRDRFLGAVGVLGTCLVVITLIAQWIPVFVIDPCR